MVSFAHGQVCQRLSYTGFPWFAPLRTKGKCTPVRTESAISFHGSWSIVIVYMPVNLNTYCIANSINSIRSKPFDTPRPRFLQMNRTGASQVFLWFEPPLSANHWVSTECVRTDFVSMVRTGATMHQNNYQAAKLT